MKILVTGGTGFLGAHLVPQLLAAGHSVRVLARSAAPASWRDVQFIKGDLKERDMLKDTLVVWGGEFGRTPMSQGGDGRDHHIKGFSYALAGGGIKAGISFGSTDDLGYAAVEDPVSVHDFHATMLYLLGVDHKRLSVKFQGLDARLTGISGDVVKGILA